MSGLLVAAIVFATITAVELPDNSGLASLVLGTRYRPIGVFAGTAAAFAMHAALAVTAGPAPPGSGPSLPPPSG